MNQSQLTIMKWNEPQLESFTPSNSIAHAQVEYAVSGHLIGTLTSEYVLHYTNYDLENLAQAQSTFVGYSTFDGTLDGKPCFIVFQEEGFHDKGLKSTFKIKTSNLNIENEDAYYTLENGSVLFYTSF